jgi:DNA repair exonuclease SbcCD nuclease subunit
MLIFITDPHLGTNRSANTTAQSSKKLQAKLFTTARNALGFGTEADTRIIAGDLFDKDSNDEATILQGIQLANMVDVVLAGNHDLPNREGRVSSLQLVKETQADESVVIAPVGEVFIAQGASKCGINITLIPHHSSQQLFNQAIDQAIINCIGGIVVTHCNFDSSLATHDDASLNITRDQAKALLEAGYSYIFNGHEHKSSRHLGGRFINLGNTHPTSMGDISEKFLWTYSEEEGPKAHTIWDEANYCQVDVSTGFEGLIIEAEFIDLVGIIDPEKGPELAEFVRWLYESPTTLMVRNRVTYTTDVLVAEASESGGIHNLAEQIEADLANSDLKELWTLYKPN